MNKESKLIPTAARVFLMSIFASLCTFMLICFVAGSDYKSWGTSAVVKTVIAQIIGLVVQLIFIYGTIWDCGNNDRQQINLGLKKYPIYRGMLIGLIGAAPFYLMAIVMALMAFDVLPDKTGLFRVFSSQFWGIYYYLFPVATSNVPGAAQIAQSIATPPQAICGILVPTIIPLLCHFPYVMGRKGIMLGEKLILKKKK